MIGYVDHDGSWHQWCDVWDDQPGLEKLPAQHHPKNRGCTSNNIVSDQHKKGETWKQQGCQIKMQRTRDSGCDYQNYYSIAIRGGLSHNLSIPLSKYVQAILTKPHPPMSIETSLSLTATTKMWMWSANL